MNGEYLELISLNIWHILASAGNLFLLTLVVKRFLFQPVKRVFAQRQEQVDALYRAAEEAEKEAREEKQVWDRRMETANEEAEGILSRAAERADRLEQEIVTSARERAARQIERAEEETKRQRKKAMDELKSQVAALSLQMAEAALGREMGKADHGRLIDSFIEEMETDLS